MNVLEIYAFVGPSGTGKSHNAQNVASKYNIEYIIDDALLIHKNKVLAGKSAKTEATKIASVKSAIFLDEVKSFNMTKVINSENIDKLLILGTSNEMVDKIAKNLKLPKITKRIYISDIASNEQINEAKKQRMEQGKHIIPVPTFEIKEQFSGYFVDPLKIFESKEKIYNEKSVIRPTFSYLGSFSISDKVLKEVIYLEGSNADGITKINKIEIVKYVDGIRILLDINIRFGVKIQDSVKKLQRLVAKSIDYMTGINIFTIDVNVKGIDIIKEENKK